MKIIKIFILPIILIFYSCEDSFNPFGEYSERYVLTCILRSDSTRQIATISKNYPELNNNSGLRNWVTGAEVIVWQGDSVYVFKDSSTIINDPELGLTEINFYYHPNLKLLPNKPLEIEALLDIGKRLKSSGLSPNELIFENVASSTVIPPVGSENFIVAWNTVGEGSIYITSLNIRYLKKINGIDTEFTYKVPVEYLLSNNQEIPAYPTAGRNTSESFSIEAITRAMELISEGEPNKEIFTIYQRPIIEVIAMDENLSRYFSVASGAFDELTVRVNSVDYSNIDGGLGVFGSYIKAKQTITKFLPEYIQSFGYGVKFEN